MPSSYSVPALWLSYHCLEPRCLICIVQGFSAQDGPVSAVAALLWVELIKGRSKGSTIGYLCTDCREIKNLFTGCTIFFSEITIMDKFP